MESLASNSFVNSSYFLMLTAVLLLSGLVIAVYVTGSITSSSSTTGGTTLSGVTVFGFVRTTGEGTHPISLVFVSPRTSTPFEAQVSNGRFSVELPNQETYNVTATWAGNYTWQHGETAVGQLPINMSAGSKGAQSYDVVEQTPDSVVGVAGTLAWQIVTSSPANIRFTASDGENFTTTISADKTFSIRLPNLMNYEVYVQSKNATGYGDWYYMHQLEVRAGVRVVGLEVNISL